MKVKDYCATGNIHLHNLSFWGCTFDLKGDGLVVRNRADNSRGPRGYTKILLGPPDLGLWDLWLSESYHPRCTISA